MSRRRSTHALARGSGRRRCGRAAAEPGRGRGRGRGPRRAFLARARGLPQQRAHLRPGAGVQLMAPSWRVSAAKSHTHGRTALRHGSWPRRARRSSNASPHSPASWKLAALDAAKSQRNAARLCDRGSLPRWAGRSPHPGGGHPVRRHAGATRPSPTQPLLRAGQPHACQRDTRERSSPHAAAHRVRVRSSRARTRVAQERSRCSAGGPGARLGRPEPDKAVLERARARAGAGARRATVVFWRCGDRVAGSGGP